MILRVTDFKIEPDNFSLYIKIETKMINSKKHSFDTNLSQEELEAQLKKAGESFDFEVYDLKKAELVVFNKNNAQYIRTMGADIILKLYKKGPEYYAASSTRAKSAFAWIYLNQNDNKAIVKFSSNPFKNWPILLLISAACFAVFYLDSIETFDLGERRFLVFMGGVFGIISAFMGRGIRELENAIQALVSKNIS